MLPPREGASNLDVAKLPVSYVAAVLGRPTEAEKPRADCQFNPRTISDSAGVRK
jgi:hypothetical protein